MSYVLTAYVVIFLTEQKSVSNLLLQLTEFFV